MLQTVFELPSIEIPIELLMSSRTIGQATPPAPFEVLNELILLWIFGRQRKPVEFTLTVLFPILKLTNEDITIWIDLNRMACLFILRKRPFVNPPIIGATNTHPFPLSSLNFSKINLPLCLDKLQAVTL